MCWSERMTECDVIVRQHGNRLSVTRRHACSYSSRLDD